MHATGAGAHARPRSSAGSPSGGGGGTRRSLVLVAVLLSPPAAAQSMDLFMAQGDAAVGDAGATAINGAIERSAREAGAPESALRTRSARAFGVERSQAVTQRVRDAVAASIDDPAVAAEFRKVTAQADFIAEYRKAFAPFGLGADDVADMPTARIIAAWLIVTGRPNPDAQAARALRDQIAGTLADDRTLAALGDAQKQALCDDVIFRTLMVTAIDGELRRKGDRDALARHAESVGSAMRDTAGIDLVRLDIGRDGLRPAAH